jgi:serine/threonine-protein kinase
MTTGHTEAATEPFKAGDKLLNYRIDSLLGRGGHAFVYAGEHLYMERPVAIKIIPAPAEVRNDIYTRARREARILSQIEHPNVVKVYDAGVTDAGVIYIVMELLAGRTLRAALHSLGPLSVVEAIHVGIQIAEAVQAAHCHPQQAIHRDLKPENVFVLPDNRIKVLDFGITKFLGASAATTQPNIIMGTPQYMSPEHMEGRPVTVRSDVFALGSVLYELLVAVAPALMGLQEISNFAIGYSQIHRIPPHLDTLSSAIPRYLDRVIQCMLAKSPADRPASMMKVANELRALQERYVRENPGSAKLRELWHAADAGSAKAGSERACNPDVHSALTSFGPIVQTNQITRVAGPLASNVPSRTRPMEVFVPWEQAATTETLGSEPPARQRRPAEPGNFVPTEQPENRTKRAVAVPASQELVARAQRLMAKRALERRAASGPVPVTLRPSEPQSRRPKYSAAFFALSLLLGSAMGYGAVVAIRHTKSTSPEQSAPSSAAHPLSGETKTALLTEPAVSVSPRPKEVTPPAAPSASSVQRPVVAEVPVAPVVATKSKPPNTVKKTPPATKRTTPPVTSGNEAWMDEPWVSTDRERGIIPLFQPRGEPARPVAKPAPSSTARPKAAKKNQPPSASEELVW